MDFCGQQQNENMLRFYLLEQDIIHIQCEEFLSAFLIKLPRCLSKKKPKIKHQVVQENGI